MLAGITPLFLQKVAPQVHDWHEVGKACEKEKARNGWENPPASRLALAEHNRVHIRFKKTVFAHLF